MKKFLVKILIFIFPIIAYIIVEGFLPANVFTYRPWEALVYSTKLRLGKTFHLNSNINMTSVGDLCYRTEYAVEKMEYWKTDKLGFRNDEFIEKADIVLVGDSFIVGSSLTQDDILSNMLSTELCNELTIYNLAPVSFSDFLFYLNNQYIQKPKILIFSIVEREVPAEINTSNKLYKKLGYKIEELGFPSIFLDKSLRLYSLKWLNARLNNTTGSGMQGINNSEMFFFNGQSQEYNYSAIKPTVDIIKSYKDLCDSLGIEFIFLPIPNKETVYYELVPFEEQPNYIDILCDELISNQVTSINTLALYNSYRLYNSELLYHTDDTHWNPKGVGIVAKALANQVREIMNNRKND